MPLKQKTFLYIFWNIEVTLNTYVQVCTCFMHLQINRPAPNLASHFKNGKSGFGGEGKREVFGEARMARNHDHYGLAASLWGKYAG